MKKCNKVCFKEIKVFYKRFTIWFHLVFIAAILLVVYYIATKVYGFASIGVEFTSTHPEKTYYFSQFIYAFAGIVLSLYTIILILVTYKQQLIQSNRYRYFSQIQIFDNDFQSIIEDINDIRYKDFMGIDALYNWDNEHRQNANSVINSLNYVLTRFQSHIKMIREAGLVYDTTSRLLTRAYLMFNSKITWPVMEILYNDSGFKKHKDRTIDKLDYLIGDTYEYLLPLKEINVPNHEDIKHILEKSKLIPASKITE